MARLLRGAPSSALLLAALVAVAPARAENADTPVEVRTCDAADAMVSAIRVELAATPNAIAKMTVVCLAGARVLVVAFPRGATAPVAREVDVADAAPDARTRSVALATGELLRSIGPAAPPGPPTTAPPPAALTSPAPIVVQVAPPPVTAAAPPVVVAAPVRKPPAIPWSLGATLHARVFPMGSSTLVGPAVELDAGLGSSPLRLRVASDLGLARGSASAGDVSLVAWTGSASLLARAREGAFFFDAGPFVEGGGAFVEGSDLTGDGAVATGSRAIAFIGAEGLIGARVAGPAVPFVAVDAGGVLAGIEALADGRATIAVRGLFVGARVGVALAP